MLPTIVKELRLYANTPRYRRVQWLILGVLAFTLFASAFELLAQSQSGSQTDVGYAIYSIFMVVFFIVQLCFAVPLVAIESIHIDTHSRHHDLLLLTPSGPWKFLAGKLMGTVIAVLWSVGLALPLFGLSIFTGGLALHQLLSCGLVFAAATMFFSTIGIHFALFGPPMYAKSRGYGTVLLITILPLAIPHIVTLNGGISDILTLFSPITVLLTILRSSSDSFWLLMSGLYFILSALLFWGAGRQLSKSSM